MFSRLYKLTLGYNIIQYCIENTSDHITSIVYFTVCKGKYLLIRKICLNRVMATGG